MKLLTVAAVGLSVLSTSAVPILLAPDHPDITAGDPNDGIVVGQPAAPAQQLIRLNLQIEAYNSASGAGLLPATDWFSNVEIPGGLELTSVNIDVSDATYIKLKWGNFDVYYFVGEEDGVVEFNSVVFNQNQRPQALSVYTLFSGGGRPGNGGSGPGGEVPDGGATAVLLGLGILGMAASRKFRK